MKSIFTQLGLIKTRVTRFNFKRLSFMALLFCMAASCNAEEAVEGCQYTRDDIVIRVPAGADIVNAFRQKSQSTSGYSDRIQLVFADGSSATILHTYCESYIFDISYYARDGGDITAKKIAAIVDRLATYNAFFKDGEKVSFKIPLPEIIETTLKTKGFDATKKLEIQLPRNKVNMGVAFFYGISYYPSGIINFGMLIDSPQ